MTQDMKRIGGWPRLLASPKLAVALGAGVVMVGTAACVQVNAPDKPIEINLNINIRQEVVYRLDGDAKKLIEQNVEIF